MSLEEAIHPVSDAPPRRVQHSVTSAPTIPRAIPSARQNWTNPQLRYQAYSWGVRLFPHSPPSYTFGHAPPLPAPIPRRPELPAPIAHLLPRWPRSRRLPHRPPAAPSAEARERMADMDDDNDNDIREEWFDWWRQAGGKGPFFSATSTGVDEMLLGHDRLCSPSLVCVAPMPPL